jgi:hypothetical protein
MRIDTSVPQTTKDADYSLAKSAIPGGSAGDAGDPSEEAMYAEGAEGGKGNAPPLSEYSSYLARLRSEGVQGWARDTARSSRLGWKGTGVKGRGTDEGLGSGSGPGLGSLEGSGTGYLDPRVRMVVTSYPLDAQGNVIEKRIINLENRFSQVPYPDRQFRKSEYTSGWWNVYIEIRTDENGNVIRYDVLRPETDGKLERLFVQQVKKEIERWDFDPVSAKIHVDVRFHVE